MLSSNPVNWILFCYFVVGSLGGIVYFVRLMFYREARTEVRYLQVPVYYGYDPAAGNDRTVYHPAAGRPGDMAQAEHEPTTAA